MTGREDGTPKEAFVLRALVLLFAVFLLMTVLAYAVDTSARFFLPQGNATSLSLGLNLVGGQMDETREAIMILEVSNCTTISGTTTCVPVGGASVNLTVIDPNNITFYETNFSYVGSGNYSIKYDFKQNGNYSMNFSATHGNIGNNSLLTTFQILGYMEFNDSYVHKFENRTVFGGYNLSFAQLNATISKYTNISVTSRETNATYNITLFLNASIPREIITLPDDSVFSPRTARIIARFLDKPGRRNIIKINETNASLAATQEIFFLLNGTAVSLNISILNVTREFAYISDHSLMVTPAFADVQNISFNGTLRQLNFTANGTGSQEVLLYVGNRSEPSNITIDGSAILTSANWTYNSTEKTIRFNYTFSVHEFGVNFPAPSAEQQEEQPSPAPGGGGGGGGGTRIFPPAAGNFTVEPTILRTSLLQDSTKTLVLVVRNTGGKKESFKVTTDSRELISVSEEEFELAPNEVRTLRIEVFASEDREPDVYVRNIFVRGTSITKIVAVVIDVKPLKPLFDIELEVLQEYKTIQPNNTILFRVTFTNLGPLKDTKIPIVITATHLESNITFARTEETEHVETQLSTVKSLKIPAVAPEGVYLITMRALVEGQAIVATDIINVRAEAGGRQALPDLGMVILILIAVAIAFAAVILYVHLAHVVKEFHRRRRSRERPKEKQKIYVRTEGWKKPPVVKVRVIKRKNAIKAQIKMGEIESKVLYEAYRKGLIDEIRYYGKRARLARRMKTLKDRLNRIIR
ncbi:MAG: hypothetical protein HYW25_04370 [Candidatus Aenigmarchaeota archaeon]|nr:hypothetical protein [Candidatus Aenigmarchaeota archaeon]